MIVIVFQGYKAHSRYILYFRNRRQTQDNYCIAGIEGTLKMVIVLQGYKQGLLKIVIVLQG